MCVVLVCETLSVIRTIDILLSMTPLVSVLLCHFWCTRNIDRFVSERIHTPRFFYQFEEGWHRQLCIDLDAVFTEY